MPTVNLLCPITLPSGSLAQYHGAYSLVDVNLHADTFFQLSKMLSSLIKCASVKGTETFGRKVSVNVSLFASDVLNCFGSLLLFITDKHICGCIFIHYLLMQSTETESTRYCNFPVYIKELSKVSNKQTFLLFIFCHKWFGIVIAWCGITIKVLAAMVKFSKIACQSKPIHPGTPLLL